MTIDGRGFWETGPTPPTNFSGSTFPEDGDCVLTDNRFWTVHLACRGCSENYTFYLEQGACVEDL